VTTGRFVFRRGAGRLTTVLAITDGYTSDGQQARNLVIDAPFRLR
jgi:hypothetical protein